MSRRIAIYLFPDVEVLDFAGPYEVFTTASRMFARRRPGAEPPFTVCTVAREKAPVRARAGLVVLPDHGLADAPAIDVLVVPGGVVTRELEHGDVIGWIATTHRSVELTASVCTGAFLLARAGLLAAGQPATTHWEDIADLRAAFPDLHVHDDRRWVDNGRVVTSAGISAGIDMSLHLVERLAGRELAEATARQMDVDWREDA
jgi:transcriptional regulator GlxA family with amidase domain